MVFSHRIQRVSHLNQ